jgi:hypothetical protein
MTSYNPIIKNGASGAVIYVGLYPYVPTGRLQSNPTLAAGDVTISKDGGAFANLGTLPDAEPNSTKSVRVILSQTETNADNLVLLFSDQTDPPEWTDLLINLQTVSGNFDTLVTGVVVSSIAANAITAAAIADGAIDAATFAAGAITATVIATGAIDADALAADTITAAKVAADVGTEIGTAVWATTTRSLTILDEDSTTLDLDATIRAAVGLASANLDTQLDALPTAAEVTTAVWAAAARTLTAIDEDSTTLDLDATIRAAVGLAAADLDTQLDAIDSKTTNLPSDPADQSLIIAATDALATLIGDVPTNAELATALDAIPTAVENADALLDRANAIETGVTPRGVLRIAGAILGGKLSGAGTGTETFRNTVQDSKDRIVATVDASGNRTAIVVDQT